MARPRKDGRDYFPHDTDAHYPRLCLTYHSSRVTYPVDGNVSIKRQSERIMQNKKKKWNGLEILFHFILLLLVVIGVFSLILVDKIQGQAATTLIGIIVAYLFGKRKK